ncbi:MAG: hypothetical protein J0I57_23690 [Hyphomicrobium sp.]|nr:hypothetical protein [Hyphomicrobium sp.]
MKTILSTLVAAGLLASAAHAEFAPFNDARQALPRSSGYEQALPYTSDDGYRQALPRSSNDEFRGALPLTDETFPDIVIATP